MTKPASASDESSKLGAACDINPRKPRLSDVANETPIMFVPMAAVDEVAGAITVPESRKLGDVRGKSYRYFAAGDVLFAKITPCMENGKAAVVPDITSGLGVGSTEFHVLRPKPGVDPRFIWHFLRRKSFRDEAKERMTGSVGQLRVPASFLEECPIYMPPLSIQNEIVRILDSADRSAGSAIDHLAMARRAIERFQRAVIAAACAGSLTAEWRASHPRDPVHAGPALSAQALRNTSGAPNSDELVDAPETWSWWAIEAATDEIIDYRGRTPPSESSGPIPHVRTTQIRRGKIDWATDRFVSQAVYDEYMTRGIPQRGDVLFTMEAPLGEVGVVDRTEPFSVAQRILLMRPSTSLDSSFLALALRSHPVRRAVEYRATGSGVLGIAYKRLRSVLLPIPPTDEQKEIVRRASQLLALGDDVMSRIEPAERLAERCSRALAARAFRGELLSSRGCNDR